MENLEKAPKTPENIENAEDSGNSAESRKMGKELEDELFEFLGFDKEAQKNFSKEIEKQRKGLPPELADPNIYSKLLLRIKKGEKPNKGFRYPGENIQTCVEAIYDGEYDNKAEAEKKWDALSREDKMIKIARDFDDLIFSSLIGDQYDGYRKLNPVVAYFKGEKDAADKFRLKIYNHLQKGVIYKDIKKLANAISKNPTEFYFSIPLREATTTLVSRMMEVDANHGVDPTRRIGQAAMKNFNK